MIVYDLETKRPIPSEKERSIEDVEYCKGWGDHENMGISVLALYDYQEKMYRIFCDDTKLEFEELVKNRSTFIGFNNIAFDNKVIKACWDIEIPKDKCYDILVKIRKKLGFFKAAGLDRYAEKNCNISKNGSGAMAPVYWQRHEYGKLFDYCLNDVRMTRRLMDKILSEGYLVDPKTDTVFGVPLDGIRSEYVSR